MKQTIPSPLMSVVADIASQRETHSSLDNLFLYSGAPEVIPEGSKSVKALGWLRKINTDCAHPLQVLGKIIENYMEEAPPPPKFSLFGETLPAPGKTPDQERIINALNRYDLKYFRGGVLTTSLATPTRTLEQFIRDRDSPSIEQEFDRALKNIESSPREAISAASNILESICKVYIAEEKLEMPAKQDLKAVWTIVRKHLGFDPSRVEDQDLQTILTGLFATVEGIGALRTHASSAHGAGKKQYKLEARHARLAIHAAHTVALFILESWSKKQSR